MAEAPGLRLMAEDAADLRIISAAVQDAVAQVGDIHFEKAGRRLVLLVNRFRWEAEGKARVRSALQLSGVMSVQARNLRRTPKDAVVNLLSLSFAPGAEAPAGVVTATFAGGGELRCEVECLDVMLADVSQPWPTRRKPDHSAD